MRLVLVSIGDMAWDALHPLIDAGCLPALARLVETGTSAAIEDHEGGTPLLATLLSGVPPAAHGILDEFEVRPDGGGIQPPGAASWRFSPLWHTLAQAGIPAAAVSCPGTAPAIAWPGCTVIDERFASAPPHAPSAAPDWPLAPGCIQPAALRGALRPLRVHPAELDEDACAGLPTRPLAYAASVQAAALAVAADPGWRFLAVSYPALGASPAAAAFHDAMLHALFRTARASDVIVVSSRGVLVAAGAGFAADTIAHGIAAADVAATVLARFGLHAPGSPGQVLPGTAHGPLRAVATTMPPIPAMPRSPPPGAEADRLIAGVEARSLRQLARAAAASGDHASAVRHLRLGLQHQPGDLELSIFLGQSAFALDDAATCRALGEHLLLSHPGPWGPLLLGAALVLEHDPAAGAPLAVAAARSAACPAALLRLGALALRRGCTADARTHYERALHLAAGSPSDHAAALAGLSLASLHDGAAPAAERTLQALLGLRHHAPAVHLQLGLIYAAQARWTEASQALRRALSQSPTFSEARAALRNVEDALARELAGAVPSPGA